MENPTVLIALFNNLPEIALGLAWSGLIFWAGRRFERRFPKKVKQ